MTQPRGRLRWHCRRALLELDLVFQRFLAEHFDQLDDSELQVLEELLALEDYDLWALVNGSQNCPHPRWEGMLATLRGPHANLA